MSRYLVLTASIVIAGGMLTACGNNSGSGETYPSKQQDEIYEANHSANHSAVHGDQLHQHTVASGDLQETTASKEILPTFLSDASDKVTLAYQAAALLPEELKQIPCYCGCGESAGHKSNFNCFIAEMKEDEVVWDDHGTRCGICVDIVLKTASLLKEGQSPSDIRSVIDELYGEGFGEPTPLS